MEHLMRRCAGWLGKGGTLFSAVVHSQEDPDRNRGTVSSIFACRSDSAGHPKLLCL